MKFPRFWARAEHEGFASWQWSDASLAEAEARAVEAARRVAARFASGAELPEGYGYPDRPMREPVLREFRDSAGAPNAVLTRNSLGCMVLNTARVMFVDVDLKTPAPPPAAGLLRLVRSLFGKSEDVAPNPKAGVFSSAERWTQQHQGWGWRVYRTAGGLRLLATHDLFAPDAPLTHSAFEALGADPLYRRLCETQGCFRARLTPKPWRCGMKNPPARWPWLNREDEARFLDWEKQYLAASRAAATCEYLRTIGNTAVHPEIAPLLAMHDDATRAESRLPLA